MNILILEDERVAAQKLIKLVNEVVSNAAIDCIGSISEAEKYLMNNPDVDLIFSDIELLDGNAFTLFKKVEVSCPIIFCTAYDKYMLQAFETNGIGYVLKPYSKEQFVKVWNKFQSLSSNQNTDMDGILSEIQKAISINSYKSTFAIKKRDGVHILKARDILFFQSQGDFLIAYANNDTKHILNVTLYQLEKQLDPNNFFRINRSEIVNFDYIKKYSKYSKLRLEVEIGFGNTKLITSNSRALAFKKWIEDHRN